MTKTTTYEPRDWAAIYVQAGGFNAETSNDAEDEAAMHCALARQMENPVPTHWDVNAWWAAAEAALADELAPNA